MSEMSKTNQSVYAFTSQTGTTDARNRIVVTPSYDHTFLTDTLARTYVRHFTMLSDTIGVNTASPLIYFSIHPEIPPSMSSSSSGLNTVVDQRYLEIEEQLTQLSSLDDEGDPLVEVGAIDTARSVVAYMKAGRIAPPSLARLDEEAIVMLWGLGDLKYAVTITEGEMGFVVRNARETIRRRSNIVASEFDVLKLR